MASVVMAPILPVLSDRPEQIEAVGKAARAAGATGVWGGMLHLRPGTREHFMTVLQRYWPELVPEYETMYRDRPYLPAAVSEPAMRAGARLRQPPQMRERR